MQEVMNSETVSGLLLGSMTVRVGMPISLLRNLHISFGLYNGTRIVITRLADFDIQGHVLGGFVDGQLRTSPKIKLSSNPGNLSYISLGISSRYGPVLR